MLSTSLIDEISRLLHEGKFSQRKIAEMMGVSRGTVNAIACGRRGLHGREWIEERSASHGTSSLPARCRCCGYRVYQPCLVCRARDYRQRYRIRKPAGELRQYYSNAS